MRALELQLCNREALFGSRFFDAALLFIKRVVPAVKLQPRRIKLCDLIYERQQPSVVAYDYKPLRPRGDEIIDELPRRKIEMVRRLVEQNKVRLFEEQAGDADSHKLAAADRRDGLLKREVRDSELFEDSLDPLGEVPQILDHLEICIRAFAPCDALVRPDSVRKPERIGDGRVRRDRVALRQVRDLTRLRLCFRRTRDFPPGQQVEQRRFSDAVLPDQTCADRVEAERERVEEV